VDFPVVEVEVTPPKRKGLASETAEYLEGARPTPARPAGAAPAVDDYPPRRPSPEDVEIVSLLHSWPESDEVDDVFETLRELPRPTLYWLRSLAADEVRTRANPSGSFDPGLYIGGARLEPAANAGLVEAVPGYVSDNGSPLWVLTPAGRRVARVLTALPPRPPYVPNPRELIVERDEL
jgi:hypothetical protein